MITIYFLTLLAYSSAAQRVHVACTGLTWFSVKSFCHALEPLVAVAYVSVTVSVVYFNGIQQMR